MRTLLVLACCSLAQPLLADAVLMKNGERYIGDVTDLGTTLRVKNAAHPDGLEVKKSDVKSIYPRPEVMIQNLRDEIEKAKARYEAGKKAADPNPELKAALDLLFDPELEVDEAIQIYPDSKAQFVELQTSIHELRKMCRDAQVSAKPAPDPGPPKPNPKPDPGAKPAPPDDSNDLYLAGPADGKPEDLEKAAKVMEARALEHGFTGVTAKVVRRGDFSVIQVACTDPMTVNMRKRLVWYGGNLGRQFEIRFGYVLTPGQAEQFPVPAAKDVDSGKARAPAGMKWRKTEYDTVKLIGEKYVLARKDLGKQQLTNGDGEVFYEIVSPVAAALHKDKSLRDNTVVNGVWFISDGLLWSEKGTRLEFEEGGAGRTWLFTGQKEPVWKIFLNVFDRPLPFTLTEVKAR